MIVSGGTAGVVSFWKITNTLTVREISTYTAELYNGTPIIWTLNKKPWTFVVVLNVLCPNSTLKSGHLTNPVLSFYSDIFSYTGSRL